MSAAKDKQIAELEAQVAELEAFIESEGITASSADAVEFPKMLYKYEDDETTSMVVQDAEGEKAAKKDGFGPYKG